MTVEPQVLAAFQQVVESLEAAQKRPHGPETSGDEQAQAADACVTLCEGDKDKARSLWRLVTAACDDYMPRAAALALIHAAKTTNMVPDVTAATEGW